MVEKEVKKKWQDETKKSVLTGVAQASGIGFAVAIPLVGGVLIGRFLDTKFGTDPKLTLSFLFLGLIIGATGVFRIIKAVEK